MNPPLLSICIATFRRGAFIGETLDSIVGQIDERVELVVLDGASPDDTAAVVSERAAKCPQLRYHREECNSGVDADYDKAVGYARGRYCWLMTDDDLLVPGAVDRILAALADQPALLVLNAEVRTVDLSQVLQARLLERRADLDYEAGNDSSVFTELAPHLKFIGAVVIDRAIWLGRQRTPYYGSLFVHVGVIFQSRMLGVVRVLAEPVMKIRYGNAMWSPRGFEIWMFLWPRLVWSFPEFTEREKARVCSREPWRSPSKLGVQRALGGFSRDDYRRLFSGVAPGPAKVAAWLISGLDPRVANSLASLACLCMPLRSRLNLYDLSRNPNAGTVCRWVARYLGV